MPTLPAGTGSTGDSVIDHALEDLARAGDNPIVRCFPQGALIAFDHDLRYLAAGGQGLGDVGLSREMLEGRTIFEAFAPETSGQLEPLYRAALRGETLAPVDVPYEGRIYSLHLAPVTDRAGRIVAGIGFTQDVTTIRASERVLRDALERSRLSFEYAPTGQALVELSGRWRQVNAALAAIVGYSEPELLNMTFQDITHPEDLDADLAQVARLVAGDISDYELEKRYITASGRTVWVLISVTLVRDETNAPLYFIAQILDITARKRSQEALEDLIAILSHDLRTPAAVISGYADVILSDWETTSDDERRDFVRKIAAASRRMTSILEESLTVFTLSAEGLSATPTSVDVAQTVRDVLDTLSQVVPAIDVTRLVPATVWIDQSHLTQVLYNLITNAIKYGEGPLTFAVEEHLSEVHLSVSDSGPGVDPDFVPHLFERFSRAEQARAGSHRGTGLGLFIVRSLLELNHSRIGYSTTPGGGATFTLAIPSCAQEAGPGSD